MTGKSLLRVAGSCFLLLSTVFQVEGVVGAQPLQHINIKRLSKQLTDPNLSKRLEAAYALGRAQRSKDVLGAAELLVTALKDKSAQVRVAAAVSIRRNVQYYVGTATERYLNKKDASAKCYRFVFENLLAAVEDKDANVRAAVLQAIGCFCVPRSYEVLGQALKSKEGVVRVAAVKGIENTRNEKFIPQLIQALDDKNTNVSSAAVHALTTLGDKRAAEPLMKMLKDRTCLIRNEVAWALGALKVEKAVPLLAEALKDPKLAPSVVDALSNIRNNEAADALLSGLKSEHVSIRRLSAGRLWGKKALKPLLQTLQYQDEDEEVRGRAAMSLGRMRAKAAVEPLQKMLSSSSEFMAASAAGALGVIGEDKAVPALIEALKNNSPLVRVNAIWSLGRLGDKRAVEPLKALLKDKRRQVRKATGRALWEGFGIANAAYRPSPPCECPPLR